MAAVGGTAMQLNDPQTLYRRWEGSQWSPFAVDLAADKRQWEGMDGDQRALIHWVLSSLMVAEERITTKFSELVGAHESEEEATFLATQQVDEARHMQFYARFQDEVVADPAAIGEHVSRRLGEHARRSSSHAPGMAAGGRRRAARTVLTPMDVRGNVEVPDGRACGWYADTASLGIGLSNADRPRQGRGGWRCTRFSRLGRRTPGTLAVRYAQDLPSRLSLAGRCPSGLACVSCKRSSALRTFRAPWRSDNHWDLPDGRGGNN